MIAATKIPCTECGHGNPPEGYACRLCGHVFRPADPPFTAAPPPPLVGARRLPACEPHAVTLRYLALGALLAPLFAFAPIVEYMGWFLASLVHETGHTATAWLLGCPAFPAIRLDGHAMARHSEQVVALCLAIWAGLVWLAWIGRDSRARLCFFGGLALLYPVAAFTGVREFLFLVGGHMGELAFAGVCFWRGLIGGFTDSKSERVAYLAVAWYLAGSNVHLAGGLLWSDSVRAEYASNGSFGLVNDYLRLARDVLKVDLSVVAGLMLLLSLAVFPLAWFLSRPVRRGDFRR